MPIAEKNARSTVYVVQAFNKKGARLVAEPPRTSSSEASAVRIAEGLSTTKAGVVAFSLTGDKDMGEFDEPVILAQHGEVPTQDGF